MLGLGVFLSIHEISVEEGRDHIDHRCWTRIIFWWNTWILDLKSYWDGCICQLTSSWAEPMPCLSFLYIRETSEESSAIFNLCEMFCLGQHCEQEMGELGIIKGKQCFQKMHAHKNLCLLPSLQTPRYLLSSRIVQKRSLKLDNFGLLKWTKLNILLLDLLFSCVVGLLDGLPSLLLPTGDSASQHTIGIGWCVICPPGQMLVWILMMHRTTVNILCSPGEKGRQNFAFCLFCFFFPSIYFCSQLMPFNMLLQPFCTCISMDSLGCSKLNMKHLPSAKQIFCSRSL